MVKINVIDLSLFKIRKKMHAMNSGHVLFKAGLYAVFMTNGYLINVFIEDCTFPGFISLSISPRNLRTSDDPSFFL